MIICAPVGAYYAGEINVLVSEKFSRAASGGVGYAKAAGNYAAAFYPTQLAQKEGYQQIIWTDASTHEYLEESGTMNVFFRIDDTLITAPTTDTILDGITRKSVIQIDWYTNVLNLPWSWTSDIYEHCWTMVYKRKNMLIFRYLL